MSHTDFIRQQYAPNISPKRRADLRAKFVQCDVDNSGYISAFELQSLLSTEANQFPTSAARMLVRIYSRQGQISFEEYVQIESFVELCRTAFHGPTGENRRQLKRTEVSEALLSLGLNFTPETISLLFKHFDSTHTGMLTLSQWHCLASLCLLGRRLFNEWDVQSKGELVIGLEQTLLIGLWFLE